LAVTFAFSRKNSTGPDWLLLDLHKPPSRTISFRRHPVHHVAHARAKEPPPLEHNPQNVPASSGRSLFFAISALLTVNFTPGHEDFCSSPSAPIFRVFCVFRGFNSPVFFVPFRAFLWLSIPLLCASAPCPVRAGPSLR